MQDVRKSKTIWNWTRQASRSLTVAQLEIRPKQKSELPAPTLLTLPAELRLGIYAYAIEDYMHENALKQVAGLPAMLQTCRTVLREAHEVYQRRIALEVEVAQIVWKLAYQQYQGTREKKKSSTADVRHVELWRWWMFASKLAAHANAILEARASVSDA